MGRTIRIAFEFALKTGSTQTSMMEEAGRQQTMYASDRTSEPVRRLLDTTRLLLIAGFGGLLLLMTFAGVDAMKVFREMQDRNDAIRQEYLSRNRLLNPDQIRFVSIWDLCSRLFA